MSAPVADILESLGQVFGRRALRWYLFGAQAALFHGSSRLTADVDVTVDPGNVALSTLIEDLDCAGFDRRTEDEEFTRRTRVLPLIHRDSGLPVDVVLAGSALEQAFLDRVTPLEAAGVRVPVMSAEDLVAVKILAGRDKDLEDARAVLLAQRSQLNLGQVREVLTILEAALDRSDLLPLLDRLSPS